MNSNFSLLAIDDFVNTAMVAEMLNILGVQIPNSSPNISEQDDIITLDPRLYSNQLSQEEEEKLRRFISGEIVGRNILQRLTPSDLRVLIRCEEELSQTRHWSRLAPSQDTILTDLHPCPSYHDVLLQAWEDRHAGDREEGRRAITEYCQEKWHLNVPEKK